MPSIYHGIRRLVRQQQLTGKMVSQSCYTRSEHLLLSSSLVFQALNLNQPWRLWLVSSWQKSLESYHFVSINRLLLTKNESM